MGKYFDEVVQRAIEKRKELEKNPAAQGVDFLNMRTTAKFLSGKQPFSQSPPVMSMVVLKFLDYTDAEIKELYSNLVLEQTAENPDEIPIYPMEALFPDPKRIPKPELRIDYDWIYDCDDDPEEEPDDEPYPMTEIPSRDEVWRYYECKSGEIFRVCRGSVFQLLSDGAWTDCRSLMSYYYDAASDYWEINEGYVERILGTQK